MDRAIEIGKRVALPILMALAFIPAVIAAGIGLLMMCCAPCFTCFGEETSSDDAKESLLQPTWTPNSWVRLAGLVDLCPQAASHNVRLPIHLDLEEAEAIGELLMDFHKTFTLFLDLNQIEDKAPVLRGEWFQISCIESFVIVTIHLSKEEDAELCEDGEEHYVLKKGELQVKIPIDHKKLALLMAGYIFKQDQENAFFGCILEEPSRVASDSYKFELARSPDTT